MNELLHTERTYVADLKCIIQVSQNDPLSHVYTPVILLLVYEI